MSGGKKWGAQSEGHNFQQCRPKQTATARSQRWTRGHPHLTALPPRSCEPLNTPSQSGSLSRPPPSTEEGNPGTAAHHLAKAPPATTAQNGGNRGAKAVPQRPGTAARSVFVSRAGRPSG
ncbi:unnamed protein product [Bubo scandiacus]